MYNRTDVINLIDIKDTTRKTLSNVGSAKAARDEITEYVGIGLSAPWVQDITADIIKGFDVAGQARLSEIFGQEKPYYGNGGYEAARDGIVAIETIFRATQGLEYRRDNIRSVVFTNLYGNQERLAKVDVHSITSTDGNVSFRSYQRRDKEEPTEGNRKITRSSCSIYVPEVAAALNFLYIEDRDNKTLDIYLDRDEDEVEPFNLDLKLLEKMNVGAVIEVSPIMSPLIAFRRGKEIYAPKPQVVNKLRKQYGSNYDHYFPIKLNDSVTHRVFSSIVSVDGLKDKIKGADYDAPQGVPAQPGIKTIQGGICEDIVRFRLLASAGK